MTLDDFLPYVLPRAQGCSEPEARLAIRTALIELCRESLVWKEHQAAVPTVALQTSYAYGLAVGQQMVRLVSATLNGLPLPVVTPAKGEVMDQNGETCNYAYGRFGGFELRPAQAGGLPIVTFAAVAPTLGATTVNDALARYAEQVGKGALSRLLAHSDKPYTDKAGAMILAGEWKAHIGEAKTDALDGSARAPSRTTSRYF